MRKVTEIIIIPLSKNDMWASNSFVICLGHMMKMRVMAWNRYNAKTIFPFSNLKLEEQKT